MHCVLFDVIDAIDLISCRDREVFRVRPDHQGNQARGYELLRTRPGDFSVSFLFLFIYSGGFIEIFGFSTSAF